MANAKKIKLPNNTTVDLIDSRIPGIDTSPAADSTNVVTSGGIKSAISNAFSDLSSSVETPLSATIGGATKTVTTLYATTANRPTQYRGTDEAGGYDLNTVLRGGGSIRNVSSKTYWAHAPSGLGFYSAVVQINPGSHEPISVQFAYNVNFEGTSPTDKIWWRVRNNDGWSDDWHLFYDSSNLTQSVLTSLLGTHYLPTAGGTMTGAVVLGNEIGIRGITTGGDDFPLIKMSSNNNVVVGGTTAGIGNVNIYGANINLFAGGSSSVATVEPTGVSVTGAVTASGTGTFDTITIGSTTQVGHLNFSRGSANYITAPASGTFVFIPSGREATLASSPAYITGNDIRPGANSTYNLGYVDSTTSNNRLWANIYGEHFELVKTGGATLTLRGTTLNNQTHTILFQGNDSGNNGFKIETTPATTYGRQSLGFYRSNVTSGSSPYTPDWKRVLYMPYTGGVEVGTTSNSENLTVNGNVRVASTDNIVFTGSNKTLTDMIGDIETLLAAI